MEYLVGEGQPALAMPIYTGIFLSIPIGSGLLIYRGLRLTRNYESKKFGWICIAVGATVLILYYFLFISWLWSAAD